MKSKIFYAVIFIAILGCAKVNLQTSQPLKVDINMRVDVYQHVAKDVESIQDQIYGSSQKQMNAIGLMEEVYADDSSASLNEAIENRKERKDIIEVYLKKGYLGESRDRYLQIVSRNIPSDMEDEIKGMMNAENADRKIIYEAVAKKNGVSVAQTSKIFFDDDYKRAPSGYWFEVDDGGNYIWKQK